VHLVQNVSNQDVQVEFDTAEARRKVMRIRCWVRRIRFLILRFITAATGNTASTATVALGTDLSQACWLEVGGGD